MDGAMIAEVKDNRILVVTMFDGKPQKFQLIPYVETEAGTQSVLSYDAELDRIATCITEFNGIPTEVIKNKFVMRAMELVEKSKATNRMVLQLLEKKQNEEAAKIANQGEKITEDIHKLPLENSEH
jgi:hypothetical protein